MKESDVKSPVIEAYCEFYFAPDPNQQLDITVVGLFYNKIREKFPIRQQQIGLESKPVEGGFRFDSRIRVQFFRPDRSALVQAAPDILTVNHLTPYASWEDFKALILDNYKIFRDIINPKGFNQIALGYVNKFDFDESTELKDYFNFHPTIPEGLSNTCTGLSESADFIYEDGRAALNIALQKTIPEKPNMLSCMLHLNYHTATPESAGHIHLDNISGWIETAHNSIEDAFKKCLTKEYKARFGVVD
jgi:uncharacterized protein (TIGR04255 family)